MRAIEKLWRADGSRRTRFHTANGTLCLAPDQLAFALLTTAARRVTGYLAPIPWIALPALRFLRSRDWSKDLAFEYSSGMSTLWYASRFARLYSVEDNLEWHKRVAELLGPHPNTTLYHRTGLEPYLQAIEETGEPAFDFISIDGSYRYECLEHAFPFLKPGGWLLIDNTDAAPEIVARLPHYFAPQNIHVFSGYASGILHPNETTVCVKA